MPVTKSLTGEIPTSASGERPVIHRQFLLDVPGESCFIVDTHQSSTGVGYMFMSLQNIHSLFFVYIPLVFA